jgi:hypothetical protein
MTVQQNVTQHSPTRDAEPNYFRKIRNYLYTGFVESLFGSLNVCSRLINFVDGHDHADASFLDGANGFQGLFQGTLDSVHYLSDINLLQIPLFECCKN